MAKKSKQHVFITNKEFTIKDKDWSIMLPKGYIFKAKSKCYQKDLVEQFDLDVKADKKIFETSTVCLGVPCEFVSFYEG